jgi:DUF4097 and DUF4098 domain-containing protein YvlB
MNTQVTNNKIRTVVTAAFVVALSTPLIAMGGDEIDKTLDMPKDGHVLVENLAGSIEFTAWDRSEAQVRGSAGDDVEEVEITKTSNGIQVKVRNRKGERRIDDTDLYLKIPKGASIEAEGVSVDITISESEAESIMLNTVSGDLGVESASQRIELAAVSGDIEFEGKASRANVESVSGDITLVGLSGEIGVSTVSGDISLEAEEVSRGRFESVSGEMTLELSLNDGGRLTSDSMSGDVYLKLPDSQQAEFTAQSYSGDIHSDFGNSAKVSQGPGVMLNHREGDNGAEVRLETFSGDISISTE